MNFFKKMVAGSDIESLSKQVEGLKKEIETNKEQIRNLENDLILEKNATFNVKHILSSEAKDLEKTISSDRKKIKDLLEVNTKLNDAILIAKKSEKDSVEALINLNKIVDELKEDAEDLQDVVIAEQRNSEDQKETIKLQKKDIDNLSNENDKIASRLENLKTALKEIAEYDYNTHKKAYLLNDFFQQRAKKALAEDK